MTRRILSIATLYPNAQKPTFGTFVAWQMEALAARGDWEVTVINPIGLPPFASGRHAGSGVAHGVQVLRPRFTLIPRIGARLNPAAIVRSVLPVARQLHEQTPFAAVDAQFFWPDGPAAARIAAELSLPLSIKARGADIHFWGQRDFARRMMRDAAEQASGLLAVSEALKADMIELGMPAGKIVVHRTGLDRERFQPRDRGQARTELAAALGVPTDGPLLATVGALIPRKGQAFVLRALAELKPGVRLAFAGTGPDETMLHRLAGSFGVAERVHFLGSVEHDRLPLLLAAADVMVLPSASEGLANAWVEALGCGTPIVIAHAGGAREVVTGPEAGRIVPREPDAIAGAVREILADPPPQAAVAATVERFSWEANAAALAAYYERLIA